MQSYIKSSKLKSLYASSRASFLAKNIIETYKELNPDSMALNTKIFEIGPGRADLASALIKRIEPEYFICDIDKKVIEFCKKRISENLKFKYGSLFEIALDELNINSGNNNLNNLFDIVISSHVIEHLKSIEEHLVILKKLLKPNGILYLSSPNTDSLDAKKYGPKWKGYQDPTHISLHSLNKILELLNSLNFKVILFGTSPKSIGDYLSFNYKNLFFSKSGLGSSYNVICQKV